MMKNLTKCQKFIILLSAFWLITVMLIASDSYNFSYAFMFILSLPVLLYWSGVWIFGFGYILQFITKLLSLFKWNKRDKYTEEKERRNTMWQRGFATWIDIQISSFFIGVVIGLLGFYDNNYIFSNPFIEHIFWFMIVPSIWVVLLEPLFISKFSTTLGKRFFNIKVVNSEGGNLSIRQSYMRNILLLKNGLCFFIPIANLFTLSFSIKRYSKTALTLWDEKTNSIATCNKVGIFKKILFFIFITLIFSASIWEKKLRQDELNNRLLKSIVKVNEDGELAKMIVNEAIKDITLPMKLDRFTLWTTMSSKGSSIIYGYEVDSSKYDIDWCVIREGICNSKSTFTDIWSYSNRITFNYVYRDVKTKKKLYEVHLSEATCSVDLNCL